MAKSLNLLDKNDPSERKVKNFAILMFCDNPEKYIKYSYVEVIIDSFGSKRKMETKYFKGPIFKVYDSLIRYISDNYLNTIVIREDNVAENRRIMNFPYIALEELVANAIVHNNYENGKAIQIYISNKQINIVNYNKPLPPLRLEDLNEKSFFNERDCENPEIRDMFKSLGIIESFGTGIGEAKRAMRENDSPNLYYKIFSDFDNVTSVVIPANEEYLKIKYGDDSSKTIKQHENKDIKEIILSSNCSSNTKHNIIKLFNELRFEVFGNSMIAKTLDCSEVTATSYVKQMRDQMHIIEAVKGVGKGKYVFVR